LRRRAPLHEWVGQQPTGKGRLAAAFDTRIDKRTILTGSAGKGIGRRIEARGFRLVIEPESSFVSGEDRLRDRRLEHAATWAV
jgi:hypothetical protein